jgi:hypothetical protein
VGERQEIWMGALRSVEHDNERSVRGFDQKDLRRHVPGSENGRGVVATHFSV